jgi:hypothetical protein
LEILYQINIEDNVTVLYYIMKYCKVLKKINLNQRQYCENCKIKSGNSGSSCTVLAKKLNISHYGLVRHLEVVNNRKFKFIIINSWNFFVMNDFTLVNYDLFLNFFATSIILKG